jgi:hypothetical protein
MCVIYEDCKTAYSSETSDETILKTVNEPRILAFEVGYMEVWWN